MSATGAWSAIGFRRRTREGAGGGQAAEAGYHPATSMPLLTPIQERNENVESSKKAVSLDLRRDYRKRGGPGIDPPAIDPRHERRSAEDAQQRRHAHRRVAAQTAVARNY